MPAGITAVAGEALTAAKLSLTIDGVEIAQFSELVGISSEVELVEEAKTSGESLFLKGLPGRRKPPTVTLKRGMSKDMGVFTWHQSVVEGQLEAQRNCTLTMYATDGTPSAKYYLVSAWPSAVEISAIKAGSSVVLYEQVTLTCEDIQRVAP